MIFVFYFFAAVLVYFSFQSFRGGMRYLDFFKKELAKPASNFAPFASVIAPCRGLDENLEKNLSALFRQNFPAYEILFVVDSENDESAAVIRKILNRQTADGTRNSVTAKLLIAGKAENEGQKVHNLREAVELVASESKIFVFVDSDVEPNENWLANLIAPLENLEIGCATGYRWFVSSAGNLASEMRSVWNASIASALGANVKSNFCWGGSTAMRREVFEKIEMRKRWCGVLSDDFAVTKAIKEFGLSIFFVPQALSVSNENCGWREFFEFSTRQMKITRVYAAHLWQASFLGAALFNLVWIWGICVLIFYSFDSYAFWTAAVSLYLVAVFSIGKSHLRLKAVRLVLVDRQIDLRRQFWTQNTLWIFSPAVFLYNCCAALFSRRIVWRGVEYELKSSSETSVISKNATKK